MQPDNPRCEDILTERLIAMINKARGLKQTAGGSLLRVEIESPGLQPLVWLAAQTLACKLYWADRTGDLEAAGVGEADVIEDEGDRSAAEAIAEVERRCAAIGGKVRYYGGFAFDSMGGAAGRHDGQNWGGFGRYRFVLPKVEVVRENGRTVVATNVRCSGETFDCVKRDVLRGLENISFVSGVAGSNLPLVLSRTDLPDRGVWDDMIRETIKELAKGSFAKVVLARQAILEMSGPVEAVSLLKRIAESTTGAYNFCFALSAHNAFLGATPECLFRRNKDSLYSEAVAGTVLTGESELEQQHYRGILAKSVKDCEEHSYVVQGIRKGLDELCTEVRVVDDRDIVCLGYVQHFYSRFSGELRDAISTADIISKLHPTAAVNGHPSDAALDHVRACEPFDRGWYAGLVGWIGVDDSEFAVAIRSAKVSGTRILVFAGAGIVRGSAPDAEWEETASKLSLFLDAINGRAR